MAVKNTYFPLFDHQTTITSFEVQEIDEKFGKDEANNTEKEILILQGKIEKPSKGYAILVPNESALLCQYIFNKFAIDSVTEKVSCLSKSPVIFASSVAIGSGYISWYPIIVGVMNIGIKSKTVKVIFSGGSWISYGSLYAWGTLKIVQELFKKRSTNEVALLKNKKHPCLSILYKGNIAILGFVATLPNAYFAYTFNQKSITWTIINILGSWGICAYPIHNMIAELQMGCLQYSCFRPCIEKEKWNQLRYFLSLKLDALLQTILGMNTDDISNLFEPEKEIHFKEETKEGDYAKSFFKTVLCKCRDTARDIDSVESVLKLKKIQYPVKILSAIFPIANIYANAKATWNLISTFTDLTIVKSLIMPFALAPSYLTYSLNRDCLLFLIRQIISKVLKKESKSISSIYYPKTRATVILTAIILSLLSSSVDYATAREIFSDDTAIDWIATIESVANSLALTLLPMIDISTTLLELSLSFFGKSEIKFKSSKSQNIEDLKFFICHSSQKELEKFISHIIKDKMIAEVLTEKFPWIADYS